MTTEEQVRELFAAEAEHAPAAVGLVEGARRRVRRRRVRLAGASGLAAVVLTGVLVVPRLADHGDDSTTGTSASCAVGYSPAEVAAHAEFALDGTVVEIGPRPVVPIAEPYGYVSVTLEVHRWFRGGGGPTVVVDMPVLGDGVSSSEGDGSPDYRVGTRLLVSGVAPPAGTTSATVVAWWGCGGFTRVYSPADAAAWAAAMPS